MDASKFPKIVSIERNVDKFARNLKNSDEMRQMTNTSASMSSDLNLPNIDSTTSLRFERSQTGKSGKSGISDVSNNTKISQLRPSIYPIEIPSASLTKVNF